MPPEPLVVQGTDDLAEQRPPRVIRRRMKDLIAYEILSTELDRYGELGRDEQGAVAGLSFFGGALLSTVLQLASMDFEHTTAAQLARCISIASVTVFLTVFFGWRWFIASRKRPALLLQMTSAPLDPQIPTDQTAAAPAATSK